MNLRKTFGSVAAVVDATFDLQPHQVSIVSGRSGVGEIDTPDAVGGVSGTG